MPLLSHIVGTRPNFVKAAPVIRALNLQSGFEQRVIHTGQHYDANLSDTIIHDVGMREPTVNLGVGSGSHARQTATAMLRLDDDFEATRPDMVIVYGDVNSSLAAALVASKRNVPIAHVESGLRSFDRNMPEETNRVLVDAMSSLLFTTSPEAADNLIREGINPESVHFVGNTMVDSLEWSREQRGSSLVGQRLNLPSEFVFVTVHRPGNLEDPGRLNQIVEGLYALSRRVTLVFPVHPRGKEVLREAGLDASESLLITPPLGYIDSTWLVENSRFVITDSGGIQEEALALGTPCFTVRDNTERPVTLTPGGNQLVSPGKLGELRVSQDMSTARVPESWDGVASLRLSEVLARILGE